MTASLIERDTPWQDIDNPISYPVKGNTKILNGTLVMVGSDGYAIPAADAASGHVVGIARQTVDTTATGPLGQLGDGAATIDCVNGVFQLGTSGGSAIALANIGVMAFVLDNQTVVLTAGTVHTVAAGLIVGVVDATHVWIDTRKKGTVIAPT